MSFLSKILDEDLDFLLEGEINFDDKKFKKKFVDAETNPEYDLPDFLDEGLKAVRAARKGDLKLKKALFRLYRAMRPFEELDFKKNFPVIKKYVTAEEIDALWDDMSEATHCTRKSKFKTSMTIKGAFFLFMALASEYLDTDSVKEIMEDNGFDFEKFGKRKRIEHYLEKHAYKLIKLRAEI